jgi:hypothetical protein
MTDILQLEHDWDTMWRLSEGQQHAVNVLMSATQGKVLKNHRIHLHSNPTYIELDIYLPEHSLAIEYQGFQHYHQTYRNSLHPQCDRDRNKRRICSELGITLLEVPYWWDSSPSRLLSAIHKLRADIPLSLPSGFSPMCHRHTEGV